MASLDIKTTSGTESINVTTTVPDYKPYIAVKGENDIYYAPLKYTECNPRGGIKTSTGSYYLTNCSTIEKYLVRSSTYSTSCGLVNMIIPSGLTDPSCGYELVVYPPSGSCLTRTSSSHTSNMAICYYWALNDGVWYTAFNIACDATLIYTLGPWAAYYVPDAAPLFCCPNTFDTSSESVTNYSSSMDILIENGVGGPNGNICRTFAAQQGFGMVGGLWNYCDATSCMQLGWWTGAGTSWNIANTYYGVSTQGGTYCNYEHVRSAPMATVVSNIKATNNASSIKINMCIRSYYALRSGLAQLPLNSSFGSDILSSLSYVGTCTWGSGTVDNRVVFGYGCVDRTLGTKYYSCVTSEGNMCGWRNNAAASTCIGSIRSDYLVEVWGYRYV